MQKEINPERFNRFQDMPEAEQQQHCKDYATDLFYLELQKEDYDFGLAMEYWEEAGGIY